MKKHLILIFSLFLTFQSLAGFAAGVDEVITKYVNALGGIDKIKAVKNEKMVISVDAGGVTYTQTMYRKRPGSIRSETSVQGKTSVQVFNGTQGWSLDPFSGRETVEAMTEDEIKEVKMEADIDGELIDFAKKGYKVTDEGEEDVDGSMAHKLKLVTDKNDVVYFFIDKDTGLLVKQVNKYKNEDGSESEGTMMFSNFKNIEGRMYAFEMEVSQSYQGQVYKTPIKVVSVEVNKEMGDDLFQKPEVKK
ncbi:MAG: LolA family protein [Bacteroidota bacterium]